MRILGIDPGLARVGFGVIEVEEGPGPGRRDGQRMLDCGMIRTCLLYTSPSPRDQRGSRMPSSA